MEHTEKRHLFYTVLTEFINEPNEIIVLFMFWRWFFLLFRIQFALGFTSVALTVLAFLFFKLNPKLKVHHEYKLWHW